MPDPVDLGYAFGLAPEKAVEYFESKGYRISWDWHDTWQEAHARAFTVARAMRLDVLQDIRGAVDEAIKAGTTFATFKQQLEPTLRAKGWWGKIVAVDSQGEAEVVQLGSVRRLKNIYRTNLQTAYMAGRWNGAVENAVNRPYWQYVAILDSKTRPEHRRMHGRVFRWDDPIWQTLYPPNDWGCRCRVRALTADQVSELGLSVESSDGKLGESLELISKRTGELQPVSTFDLGGGDEFKPGVGWNYNPGAAHWLPDLNNYPYDTARQYTEGALNGPPFQYKHSRLAQLIKESEDQGMSRDSIRRELRPLVSAGAWPSAVASPTVVEMMNARRQAVLLSDDTLVKQMLAHPELKAAEYGKLQQVMDRPLLLVQERDGLHHLFFGDTGQKYRAVVKVTGAGELYLQSFHRARDDQVERAGARGKVLVDNRKD